jgi:hypothetical protein
MIWFAFYTKVPAFYTKARTSEKRLKQKKYFSSALESFAIINTAFGIILKKTIIPKGSFTS